MATLTFKKKKKRLSAILGEIKESNHKKPVKALNFSLKSLLCDGGKERFECLLCVLISWLELCKASAIRTVQKNGERKEVCLGSPRELKELLVNTPALQGCSHLQSALEGS